MRDGLVVGSVLWGAIAACGDDGGRTRLDGEDAHDSDAAPDVDPSSDADDDAPADTSDTPDTAPADVSDTTPDTVSTWGTRSIPDDLEPCDDPRYWPLSVASATLPVRVHYRTPAQAALASDVLGYLELGWAFEVGTLGFRPPLPDDGRCAADAAMDVFLWKNAPSVATDLVAENPDTPWFDGYPVIVLDTRGELAGDALDVTTVHELNHACQAADDWWDVSSAYEATATYVEDQIFDDDDDYLGILADFQAHPEWPVDYDDGYDTYFMYGAALYLHYLHERFFPDDPAFIGRIWEGMRSVPPDNEPDFDDAIDDALSPWRRGFVDSLLEFARWRYYVGHLDDARHLAEAGAFPDEAAVRIAATLDDAHPATPIGVMLLGANYIALDAAGTTATVTLSNADDAPIWSIQAVPGTTPDSDGDTLALVDGAVTVPLVDGRRVLVVMALPAPGMDADPDTRSFRTYRATLTLGRATLPLSPATPTPGTP